MRFHQMMHAALASIFVVPAVTLTQGESKGLEAALTQTVEAIESLSGLRTRLDAPAPGSGSGSPIGPSPVDPGPDITDTDSTDAVTPIPLEDAVAFVLGATEIPRMDGAEQDRLLDTLRRDVSRLQMVLDDLTARKPAGGATGAGTTDGSTPAMPIPESPSGPGTVVAPGITTGLDEQSRAALLHIQPPVVAPEAIDDARVSKHQTDEGEAYTADALRLGHAYYRAGRYAEGYVILSKQKDDVEARYWTARCLEHLDRHEEALKAYEEVVAHPKAGYLADRATSDLAFLRWKREFAKRVEDQVDDPSMATGMTGTETTPKR